MSRHSSNKRPDETSMTSALDALSLAHSYADDGALHTAIERAEEAITILRQENVRRAKLMAKFEKKASRKK